MRCIGDGTWNEQEGYEMLKDLKRIHKLKVKKMSKAPQHVVKILSPADLPEEVKLSFYREEDAVPTGTWNMAQTKTGQLRKRRSSDAIALPAASPKQDHMAMAMIALLNLMNSRNEGSAPESGGLHNLQIFANKRQKAQAPSAAKALVAPPAVEEKVQDSQESQASHAEKASPQPSNPAETQLASLGAEAPGGKTTQMAPVSHQAIMDALTDRAREKPKAKAKAKGKAKAKAKSVAKAMAKSVAKAKAAPTPEATPKAATPKAAPKSRIVHQIDPGCPPPNSGTWWYKDGKIQASSADAFRVFLKTTDRCDRTWAKHINHIKSF